MNQFEDLVVAAAKWVELGLEAAGVVVVAVGFVAALLQLARILRSGQRGAFPRVRLTLARHLALALEFQLGADILATSVSPTWDQIGKLAAIAVIRTGLTYFLSKEMKEEESELHRETGSDR